MNTRAHGSHAHALLNISTITAQSIYVDGRRAFEICFKLSYIIYNSINF